ncbi:MAG: ABC transporter ATP-binding protein, partial [Acidimicrobiia bacterium]
FGAVDPVTRGRLQEEFVRLQDELGKTVVFVTHDIDEALRLGDRLAVLAEGGRLAQHGTPAEVLARPASEFVAGFVGAGATLKRLGLLPVTVAVEAGGPAGGGRVAAGATLAEATDALLRAEGASVTVMEGDRVVGVVTLASIQSALRRSEDGAGPGRGAG